MKCINPRHDHELADNDRPGLCNDCGQPSHHDEGSGWYHHDDPLAPPCFLTAPHTAPAHSRCIVLPEPDSKWSRNMLDMMIGAIDDDVHNLVEELLGRSGIDIDWEDDGDLEKYEMPITDAIYGMLAELLGGMTDND